MRIRLWTYGSLPMFGASLALLLAWSPGWAENRCCIPKWRQPWSTTMVPGVTPDGPPVVTPDPKFPPDPKVPPSTTPPSVLDPGDLTRMPLTTAAGSGNEVINFIGSAFGGSSLAKFTIATKVPVRTLVPKACGCGGEDEIITLTDVFTTTSVFLPNPSRGGVVGRANSCEDANPLPRDRFIFNYDYFTNTPLSASGWDVHRYVVGFEKTFLDQIASVEVRLPFASTLDSNIHVGNEKTNQELGNLRVTLRTLLYRSDKVFVGSGVDVHLPTGDDVAVFLDGQEMVHVENQGVVVSPYLGVLFAPTERFFTQGWVAANFDAHGNNVRADVSGAGLTRIGRLQDNTSLEWDLQVGYWLIQNPNARVLRGLAPLVELHYGTSVQDADLVTSSNFTVGDLSNRGDELNLTAGFTAWLGNNLMLTMGAVTPLRHNEDRSFDFQLSLRLNWFFGPTAADNNLFRFAGR